MKDGRQLVHTEWKDIPVVLLKVKGGVYEPHLTNVSTVIIFTQCCHTFPKYHPIVSRMILKYGSPHCLHSVSSSNTGVNNLTKVSNICFVNRWRPMSPEKP